MQGVYQITNIVNGKKYIGSSIDIKKRWIRHRSKLNNNKHFNQYLQNSWNKHGEQHFEFEVIELVNSDEDILTCEQWYLDNWKPKYNIAKYTKSSMKGRSHSSKSVEKLSAAMTGENNPMFGKTHSTEAKKKMSDFAKIRTISPKTRKKLSEARSGEKNPQFGKTGEKSPRWGKKHSDETRRLMSEKASGEKSSQAKLTETKALKIRELFSTGDYTKTALAKMFGVCRATVRHVVNRKTWKHI